MYASVGGELLHYGVLGMKWGVRKERETKGRKGKFGSRSDDDEKYDILDKDLLIKFRKMSGSELFSYYTDQTESGPVDIKSFLSRIDFQTLLDEKKSGLGVSYGAYIGINAAIRDPAENKYFKPFAQMVKERDGYNFPEAIADYVWAFVNDDYETCVSIGEELADYLEEYNTWKQTYVTDEEKKREKRERN